VNIGFFIPELSSKGGAEVYLTKVIQELARHHDIKLYTMDYNRNAFPGVADFVVDLGLPWLARRMHGLKVSALTTINAVKAVSKRIPSGHDLYNVHIFPSNFISHRKPMVWTAQEPPRMLYDLQEEIVNSLTGFQKIVARVYFPLLRRLDHFETDKNINHIIANSNYAAKYLQSLYDKPLSVIYPGIDGKFFKVKNKDEKVLLSVGRLYGVKRVDLIINAFSKIVKKLPDYKLEIIGTGPMMPQLKLLVKKLKLNDKVSFLGEVSERELLSAYSRASALLYYPLREMFGMVPLEAMASGVPVIAVDEGGFTELTKNNIILTKPQLDDIVSHTIKVLGARRRLASKARASIKEFTWARTARETEKVFKNALMI